MQFEWYLFLIDLQRGQVNGWFKLSLLDRNKPSSSVNGQVVAIPKPSLVNRFERNEDIAMTS